MRPIIYEYMYIKFKILVVCVQRKVSDLMRIYKDVRIFLCPVVNIFYVHYLVWLFGWISVRVDLCRLEVNVFG